MACQPRQAKNYCDGGHRLCHYCLGLTHDKPEPRQLITIAAANARQVVAEGVRALRLKSTYPGLRVEYCHCCEVDANVVRVGLAYVNSTKLCPFCCKLVTDKPWGPPLHDREEEEYERLPFSLPNFLHRTSPVYEGQPRLAAADCGPRGR